MPGGSASVSRTLVFGLVVAAGGAAGRRAWAQGGPFLSVTRMADAQDCPDKAGLVDRVAAIRGADAAHAPPAALPSEAPAAVTAVTAVTFAVTFARAGDTFSAAIRSSLRPGSVRRLEVPGATCAALARATAVTLALLLDSDAASEETPHPAEPSPAPPPAPAAPEAPPPAPTRATNRLTIAAGASALVVTLRPVAPAFTGELGLEVGPWRTGLGVLWAPAQSLSLGPGTVSESLASSSLRVCYSPWRSDVLRTDLCAGAYVGLEAASGQGYTRNDDRTRPWLAIPFELTLAGRREHVGWELGAGALVSVLRQDFSIDGLGDAYRPPLVGAIVSLRAVGLVPW